MAKKAKPSPAESPALPVEMIERRIFLILGHNVMLDSDLAELYGVATGNLNLAVRRNKRRFPEDFMFQLNAAEQEALILQIARAKSRGGRRTPPYAFTEQGVAMLSTVLHSERAILVNIAIMRAFVRIREVLATHKDLARRMADLERQQKQQGRKITDVFKAIQKLLEPPEKPKRQIGFQPSKKK